MRSAVLLSIVASISSATAVYTGFNYGSTQSDGTIKDQQTFEDEFKTAKSLVGTSGFTSARLYTMIQGPSANDPISAIPAAIAQETTLLLGLWASGGDADFDNEIQALKNAISQYGDAFTSLVTGISVGSEDLYRSSELGVESQAGVGVGPDVISNYIGQVKSAIASTSLSKAPVGHVDTWTAWVNSSNNAVIEASDFIGMDAYPYFQNTMSNSIESAKQLFFSAYDQTVAAAEGKDVWITETGWPVSGKTENLGIPSTANAETYWQQVACSIKGKYNTYWYTLQDSSPDTPNPSFGLVGSTLTTTPMYDLSCDAVSSSSSSSASSTKTSSSSAASSSKSSVSSSVSSVASGSHASTVIVSVTTTANASSATSSASASGSTAVSTNVVSNASMTSTVSVPVSTVVPTTVTSMMTSFTESATSSATVSVFTGAAVKARVGSVVGGAIGAMVAVAAAL